MALNLNISNLANNSSSLANRFIPSSANIHPYVKGYFYVYYQFPSIVLDRTGMKTNGDALSGIMLSLCEGYTPAGDRQIKYEDVVGMGDVSSSFVVGQTVDRNFSLAYREIWGSPVLRVHRAWTSIIDPVYGGFVKYKDDNGDVDFMPKDYKGKVLVIQTKPIAVHSSENSNRDLTDSIISVDLYTGVFPTTDLSSMYDANITDNSIVRPTVQYRFDGVKYDDTMDSTLKGKAASILNNKILAGHRMDKRTIYNTQ